MKKFKLFALAAVTALFAACSSDDNVANENEQTSFSGQACMMVRIADAAQTRAASGYEDGTGNENTITKAKFYFYDQNGAYVTTADIWTGQTQDNVTTDDIEFNGNTVLVLKGLDQDSYPKYMVTVINPEDNFLPANTLDEMEGKLSSTVAAPTHNNAIYTGTGADAKFKMSVSRKGVKDASGKYPTFTTVLSTTDFLEYKVGEDPKTKLGDKKGVTVYVERLAAKVRLGMNIANDNIKTVGGVNYYKVDVTMAFMVNKDPNTATPSEGEVREASTSLYMKIDKWGLNNLNKTEYMVKNVDDAWYTAATAPWDGWTDNYRDHRNFWALSTVYNKANNTPTDPIANYFDIYTYNDIDTAGLVFDNIGTNVNYDYCTENTSLPSLLKGYVNSRSTSAIMIGKVYEYDAENDQMKAVDLIDFHGVYFKLADYKAYILNSLYNSGTFKYCKKDGADKLKQLDVSDIQIVTAKPYHDGAKNAINTGGILVKLADAAPDVYPYSEWKAEFSATEYATITATASTKLDVNNKLTGFNGVTFAADGTVSSTNAVDYAYNYAGGLMYWVVPIEHLNTGASGANKKLFETSDTGTPVAGVYGVVRNHVYDLSIKQLKNFGWAVHDPNEALTPNDNNDGKKYALPTTLKVLSWRIVDQNVNL